MIFIKGKHIDLSGQKFGKLTVIEKDKNCTNRVKWLCQCDCGNVISTRTDALSEGRSTSCGKCKNDLVGRKFGRLTVVKKVKSDKAGHSIWECKCDCGNIKTILGTSLVRGLTLSCGCLHKETMSNRADDLVGLKFGHLTVLSLVSTSPRIYLCRCDCGGLTQVSPSNLKTGHTQSCGCLSSLGEEKINHFLTQHNLPFVKEYSVNIKGFKGRARYDFALLNNDKSVQCLIEYQGRQHYEQADTWSENEEDFIKRQKYDNLKREWAKSNNIPLYEIPYWELDNIDKVLLNIIKDMEEAQEIVESE